MRSLFGWLDMFKPGVFADVLLRQAIGSRTRHRAQAVESRTTRRVGEVRRSSSSALRVPAESVVKNVRRLGRLVEKFRKNDEDSVWKDYMETRPYSETGIEQKRNFVGNVLKSGHGVVWDLGANTGEFSFAAARHSAQVLAIESDHGAADLIYRGAREKNITNLNVIVDDIVNPSPSMGFALEERKSLFSRSRPDLCLALALIHHLVLTRSVPLDLLIPWTKGVCPKWVFEFAHENDPMVKFLKDAKLGHTHTYSRDEIEKIVAKSFRTLDRLELSGTDRTLYLAEAL